MLKEWEVVLVVCRDRVVDGRGQASDGCEAPLTCCEGCQ